MDLREGLTLSFGLVSCSGTRRPSYYSYLFRFTRVRYRHLYVVLDCQLVIYICICMYTYMCDSWMIPILKRFRPHLTPTPEFEKGTSLRLFRSHIFFYLLFSKFTSVICSTCTVTDDLLLIPSTYYSQGSRHTDPIQQTELGASIKVSVCNVGEVGPIDPRVSLFSERVSVCHPPSRP